MAGGLGPGPPATLNSVLIYMLIIVVVNNISYVLRGPYALNIHGRPIKTTSTALYCLQYEYKYSNSDYLKRCAY